VKLDFLVSGTDKMVDDVGGGSVSTSAAEPFATSQAFDNTAWSMNATVS
jgi:hypothetical protein